MTIKHTIILYIIVMCLFNGCELRPAQADRLWKITYYCSCEKCCGKWADGHFASGRKVYAGGVACNWLSFGTKIKINNKIYTIEDRGARSLFGSKNNHIKHIDIWLDSHQEALNKGVEWRKVVVLGK